MNYYRTDLYEFNVLLAVWHIHYETTCCIQKIWQFLHRKHAMGSKHQNLSCSKESCVNAGGPAWLSGSVLFHCQPLVPPHCTLGTVPSRGLCWKHVLSLTYYLVGLSCLFCLQNQGLGVTASKEEHVTTSQSLTSGHYVIVSTAGGSNDKAGSRNDVYLCQQHSTHILVMCDEVTWTCDVIKPSIQYVTTVYQILVFEEMSHLAWFWFVCHCGNRKQLFKPNILSVYKNKTIILDLCIYSLVIWLVWTWVYRSLIVLYVYPHITWYTVDGVISVSSRMKTTISTLPDIEVCVIPSLKFI